MERKIRIGIDVDDCICNTAEIDYACAYYATKQLKKHKLKKKYDYNKFFRCSDFDMTPEESFDFYIKQKKYIMKHTSMYPKVFAKEVINKLRTIGFEIYFISSRDNVFWNGDSTKYLKKWLKKFKIESDGVYSSVVDKQELCKKLGIDLMVEDNPNFIAKVNESGIESCLILQPYNASYKHKLNFHAENWLDFYDKICEKYGKNNEKLLNFGGKMNKITDLSGNVSSIISISF